MLNLYFETKEFCIPHPRAGLHPTGLLLPAPLEADTANGASEISVKKKQRSRKCHTSTHTGRRPRLLSNDLPAWRESPTNHHWPTQSEPQSHLGCLPLSFIH